MAPTRVGFVTTYSQREQVSMSNPYLAPANSSPTQSHHGDEVKAPAIALMVVSILALVLGSAGLIFDVFLIAVQGVTTIEIIVRSLWGVLLLISAAFVLFGAIKMKNKTDYGVAKAAAIVAIIPFVGPCCLIGIPFGIWAVVVLSKPHVKAAFR